jgi:hypothetical protein
MRETGNPFLNPRVAARSISVMKRDNTAKKWIVMCNSGAFLAADAGRDREGQK